MALTLRTLQRQREEADGMATVRIDRRLYLDAEKKRVVEEGDPRARFLYTTPGSEVPAAEAERYGLLKRAKAKAEDKALKTRVEDK